MKKILTLIISITLLLGIQTIVFADSGKPVISVDSVSAKPGASIDVPIRIQNNTGICGATLNISFDSNLSLTSVNSGSAFSSLTFTKSGGEIGNKVKLLWDGVDADYSNGIIAVLTFKAPDKAGDFLISASYEDGDIIDGDLNPVDISITNGAIRIGQASGITIIEHPESVYTQPDSSVTWKVNAKGTNLSYQWQYRSGDSWSNFAGAISDTMTKKVPVSWNGWYIRCQITDSSGQVVYTNNAKINIVNDIIITEQPEDVITAPDASVLWSVNAEGDGLTYQWQYKNGSSWSNFSGATTSSMTKKVPASWDGWQIRCQIKDAHGVVIYTTISKIEINSAIVIQEQPESITVGPATTNTWTVKATGDGLTYQWQYKEKNKNTWNNFKDATTRELTKAIPATWDEWSVRCMISDKNGNTIYSKIVKIDINTDIIIESQPENVLAEANSSVTWEVEATGNNLKYQWQYKTGNNWNNFAGATEATMTKKVQESWNGWPIRCKISDSNGNVIYTRTVTLKIGTAIVISEQPEDVIARAGDSVTWSVKATGDNLSYQWQYKDGKNWSKFSGATGTSLTKKVPETWDGWQIRCMLTDAEGNQSFTNVVTLYIGTPIIISQQPQNLTVTAGQAATWSIRATGDRLTYQWQYKNGKNWNNFAGATGTSMTKNVPATWNGWQVRCQITDGEGHVIYSKAADVTVK